MTNNPDDPDYAPDNAPDQTNPANPAQPPKKNAAADYQWNANNVFNNWDLNPLAMQVGQGADGVRDTLSAGRDAFLEPQMQAYRQAAHNSGHATDASDIVLYNDPGFRNYVQNGQLPDSFAAGSASAASAPNASGSAVSSWLGTTPEVDTTLQQTNSMVQQMLAQQQASAAANQARGDQLYSTLMGRAQQGTTIDPNDPNIRAQIDAFRAEQTRAARNAISNNAESAGPNANTRGYNRMVTEDLGQSVGNLKSQLIGSELQNRRNEIAQALAGMQGMLSGDQQLALEKQLGLMDNAIKQQGVGLSQQGVNNNLLQTLLQNQQFNSGLQSQNDQFASQLGFNTANQASYWDALRSGLIS